MRQTLFQVLGDGVHTYAVPVHWSVATQEESSSWFVTCGENMQWAGWDSPSYPHSHLTTTMAKIVAQGVCVVGEGGISLGNWQEKLGRERYKYIKRVRIEFFSSADTIFDLI